MTRETKIGLLVGLAFIIVVGILLSEHLTTTTERPAAPLAEAGDTVRDGVAAPGVSMKEEAPPVRVADPVGPVPTSRDLAPAPQPGPAHVSIGGPNAQSPIVIDNVSPITPGPVSPNPATPGPGSPLAQNDTPIVTRLPGSPTDPFANGVNINEALQQAARNNGEQLVPAGNTPKPEDRNNSNTLAANNVREYKAQPGDSLSRIAALLPGGNTKANREAVVKLNPVLQKDPNKIVAGRTYLLPTSKTASAPAPTPSVTEPSPVTVAKKPEAAAPTPTPAPAAAEKFRTYVVKKGDTLTKIASAELGSKNDVDVIKKLNEDVLKGTDVIKVDMKLKLPIKTAVASND